MTKKLEKKNANEEDKERVAADSVVTPDVVEGHVFHQYTIRVTNVDRDAAHQSMLDAGVGCMVYYPTPQDLLPVYANDTSPHAVSASHAIQVISLPIWPELDLGTQQIIVKALAKALA